MVTPEAGPPPVGNAEAQVKADPAPEPAPVKTIPAAEIEVPEPIAKAVNAKDRQADDKSLDEGRQPAKTLAFFGIAPGMKVAELGTGRGYTAELLARIVGTKGRVYAQNNQFVLQRFAEKPWSERLKKRVMKNVVRVDSEFDAPLPAEATDLDAVVNILFYHDTVWQKVDRDAMNRAIFKALKPGGVYGIVDHAAAKGAGIEQTQTLHRIERSVLRQEVERAGFRLDAQTDLLANPEDDHSWNAAPSAAGDKRGTSDRFVFRFVKPE
jgi:predicted methyltransferase